MKLNMKKLLLFLVVAFVIVFIYRDPQGASNAIGPFLGDIGNLVTNTIDSGAEFLAGFDS